MNTDDRHDAARDVLNTVSVPEPFRDIFLRAQHYVEEYFSDRASDPTHGSITIAGERYILVRAASMSVEFFELVASLYRDKGTDEARSVAKNLLFDVAHAIGKADAKVFQTRMGVSDPVERMSAGPVHFAYAGWANVLIHPESRPQPSEDFYLIYDHPYSFEADAWLKRDTRVEFPVCVMNSGYSSGWCEDSFGLALVAAEVECRAMGDEHCRFVMAPPSRIEQHVSDYFTRAQLENRSPQWRGDTKQIEVPEFFQRKRMEDALRASHEVLEQRVAERTRELSHANEALTAEMADRQRIAEERAHLEAQLRETQKLETLGVLAGGIAHDFNNLLTVITGNLELLEMRLQGDKERALLKRAQDASEMGARLTRRLLTFARRRTFEATALDLNDHVIGMAELLERTLGEPITLTTVLERMPWTVLADGSEIENVILNLAINARDAMPNGGKLIIQTSNSTLDDGEIASDGRLPAGDYVRLSISDTGVGMAPEVLQKAFEPFFTTKEPGKGTGLGLSTVYGFAQHARGAATIYSEVGRGTTVNLYLPRADQLGTGMGRSAMTAGVPNVAGTSVLLVEDNPDVRQVTKGQLELLGCHVTDVASGPAAIDVLSSGRSFRVVLSDVVMAGGMSGFDVVRWVRSHAPDSAVLLASGYPDEVLRQQKPDDSDFDILRKPYSRSELARALRRVLGEAATPPVAGD